MGDIKIYCTDDDVYCKCRTCADSRINGGNCSHCLGCMQGGNNMNVCDAHKRMEA